MPFHGAALPMWLLVAWVVLLGTAEPALAGLVAPVAIGEVLSPVQLAGGAAVLAGILLAVTARERPPGDGAPGDARESTRPATTAWHSG